MPKKINDLPTRSEVDCVAAIAKLTEELGHPPSVRELGKHLGVSNIYDTLQQCRRKGFIGDGKIMVVTRMRITPKGRRLI